MFVMFRDAEDGQEVAVNADHVVAVTPYDESDSGPTCKLWLACPIWLIDDEEPAHCIEVCGSLDHTLATLRGQAQETGRPITPSPITPDAIGPGSTTTEPHRHY